MSDKNKMLLKISLDPEGRLHLDTEKNAAANKLEYICLLSNTINMIARMDKKRVIVDPTKNPGKFGEQLKGFLKKK